MNLPHYFFTQCHKKCQQFSIDSVPSKWKNGITFLGKVVKTFFKKQKVYKKSVYKKYIYKKRKTAKTFN